MSEVARSRIDRHSEDIARAILGAFGEPWLSTSYSEEIASGRGHEVEYLLFYTVAGADDFLHHVKRFIALSKTSDAVSESLIEETLMLRAVDFGSLAATRAATFELLGILDALVRAASMNGVEPDSGVRVLLARSAVRASSLWTQEAIDLVSRTVSCARRSRPLVSLRNLTAACARVKVCFDGWHADIIDSRKNDQLIPILNGCLAMQIRLCELAAAMLTHQAVWESFAWRLARRADVAVPQTASARAGAVRLRRL
ncbi:MAG: hypothetical protein H5T75_08930 [Coriobacteriia bacterium]|jgi:hypothetical protein|nr:hypothetical protein [Coriobacteriia bacterium]GAV31428.1 hypothetical protein emb_1c0152 [Coriobacteriaceae bacterium EMTCatB1]